MTSFGSLVTVGDLFGSCSVAPLRRNLDGRIGAEIGVQLAPVAGGGRALSVVFLGDVEGSVSKRRLAYDICGVVCLVLYSLAISG